MESIVYGRKPLEELLRSSRNIDKIYIDNALKGDFEKKIRRLCKEKRVALVRVPKFKLDKITKKEHQGVVAWMSPIEFQEFEDVLASVFDRGENPFFLVLDGVSDVRNVGAISRTAHVMGVHGILIGSKGVARINEDAMKASSGALAHIPICRENGMSDILRKLKLNGILVVATDNQKAKNISEVDLSGPCAIVMGDEGRGVSNYVLDESDLSIRIPQVKLFDSLNVSVATGIVLYEVVKQKGI